MIIDEDQDDGSFLTEAIEGMFNSSVSIEANDVVDALNQLRKAEQFPDFIFLDVDMPRMNERECLKELKKDANLKAFRSSCISLLLPIKVLRNFRLSEHQVISTNAAARTGTKVTFDEAKQEVKPTDMNKLPAQILEAIGKPI